MKKIKLFCIPYAGGGAMAYSKWKNYMDGAIELCPVELAGRGKRFRTPSYNTMEDATNDVYNIVMDDLDKFEYAFWGHSMGCLIVYELINRIASSNHRDPSHIFLSGRYPPHIYKNKSRHTLPDDQFIQEISKLGGTANELLREKELLDIFIPILRADYRIVENYKHSKQYAKWNFDITILTGNSDEDVSAKDIIQWEEYTNKKCRIINFDGGHFFIHDRVQEIAEIINDTLVCKCFEIERGD
ncbi:MAG: thioesterase domain-containing protein [Bacillota bacterium]|nr:thioesterase domain-containing protein [Bacillota bacterium]